MAFLTYQYKVCDLDLIIYADHLKLHLLNHQDIYSKTCTCTHRIGYSENSIKCGLATTEICIKCNSKAKLLVPSYALMYHDCSKRFMMCDDRLYYKNDKSLQLNGCSHTHTERCGKCLNCNYFEISNNVPTETNEFVPMNRPPCLALESLTKHNHTECLYTTDTRCEKHGDDTKFTSEIPYAENVFHHIYNTQNPLFYVCYTHRHYHWDTLRVCYLQYTQCCVNAIHIKDYNTSFNLTVGMKNFIIYAPVFWKEQSLNHFISLVRTIVACENIFVNGNGLKCTKADCLKIKERNEVLKTSKYKYPISDTYLSGKYSFTRTKITGFQTDGIHQTSIISCCVPYNIILMPDSLYDQISILYDMEYAIIKRDPSIKPTCMYVVKIVKYSDYEYSKCIAVDPENINTLCISDLIAVPMNNDQDGDKNGIYLNAKVYTKNGITYDRTKSHVYNHARLEMEMAQRKMLTILGSPKYCFSEHNWYVLHRFVKDLLNPNDEMYSTFVLTLRYSSINYANGMSNGYHVDYFNRLHRALIEFNATNCNNQMISVSLDDLFAYNGEHTNLSLIHECGIAGHENSLRDLAYKFKNKIKLSDNDIKMLDQMFRYINSLKKLRLSGRKQFTMIFAFHDLVTYNGFIYLNKALFADVNENVCFMLLAYNRFALEQCVRELDYFALRHFDEKYKDLTLLEYTLDEKFFVSSKTNDNIINGGITWVQNLNVLTKIILTKVCNNDSTLRVYYRGIAFAILLKKFNNLDEAIKLVSSPEAKSCILKLISNATEFYSCTPKPLLEVVALLNAEKMQDALNVKRALVKTSNTDDNTRIIPEFKEDMLYKHKTKVWVRFYLYDENSLSLFEEMYKGCYDKNIVKIDEKVYEIYFEKSHIKKLENRQYKNFKIISHLIRFIDINKLGYVIFCSELALFQNNYWLFLSNFIKFYFCYKYCTPSFNPHSTEHFSSIAIYTLLALMFKSTKNLNKMPMKTHNPLIAFTGERPSDALNAARQSNQVFNVEGSRAMMSINQDSDFGAFSNFIELQYNIGTDFFLENRHIS